MRKLTVRVFYAASVTDMHEVTLVVEPGATIESVIHASGMLARYPEIDLGKNEVGIFSRRKKITDEVNEGDRVEIYRPLQCDPKEARRARA